MNKKNNDNLIRIDKYLSQKEKISRTQAKELIENKLVFLKDMLIRKSSFLVHKDAKIKILPMPKKKIKHSAKKMDLDIIFEDQDLIVLNKPSGLVVHPAPGHKDDTLVNGLLYYLDSIADVGDVSRPGIVHRLDKDTSGLLIIAKNNKVHQLLSKMFQNHKVQRTYLAFVEGKVENEIIHINLPIGKSRKYFEKREVKSFKSKVAITHVYVKKIFENKTLVECKLETGRTHQIRVHLSYIKHPVLGDPLYGQKIDNFGQRLHAYKLEFTHPISKKKMKFIKKPPEKFYK